jgi:hypothetical protein
MAPSNPIPLIQRKDHDLTGDEKQRIRRRIGSGDGDVYKLATEFHCAPIQIAGIKAAIQRERDTKPGPTTPHRNIQELADPRGLLNHLISSARRRAQKMPVAFNLTLDFLADLYGRQEGMCAVSRLRFNMKRIPEALVKHPFAPSIDRIDSKGGYTQNNVRLVCVAVNFGMGEWGTEVYLTLARSAVAYELQEKSEDAVPAPTPATSERQLTMTAEMQWRAKLEDRLQAAEELLPLLNEIGSAAQRHRIAGLQAALAKGYFGVKVAASKAWQSRQS